jgi:GAF domain-containing protein
MNWDAITAISSLISMVAFVATAVFVARQLSALERSQYLQVTSELYSTWQSREFMDAQLWLIHRLEESTWESFIKTHRADYGEQAFHRVGSFYDRIGTLVRLGLVDEREILSTIGAYAIAVWQKIEPLVQEARRYENSSLFDDFEAIMPACYECYVPNLQVGQSVKPFHVADKAPVVSVQELRKRLDKHEPVTVLDVRQPTTAEGYRERLPGAVVMEPDTVVDRWSELPKEKDVVAYCT